MDITWEEFESLSKEVRATHESKLEYTEASYDEITKRLNCNRSNVLNGEEQEVINELLYLNGYIYDLVLNGNYFSREFVQYYQGALSFIEVNEELLVELNRVLSRITFNLDLLDLIK